MTQETLFSLSGSTPTQTAGNSPVTPVAAPQSTSLMDNAFALSIELRRLGTKRKVNTAEIEIDAEKELIHVSKEILESEALTKIKKFDGETRSYIAARCLPAPMFRAGVWLLPIGLLDEVIETMKSREAQREALVAAFLDDYEDSKDRARVRLRSQFKEDEYPPVAAVRRQFSMTRNFMEFGVPGRLRAFRPDLYQQEMEKAKASIANATESITQVLRAAMADVTDHLLERLSPKADGTQKIFRDSLIGNLKDFLDTFNARNITGDQELSALVEKARMLADGVDPKDLRTDEAVRAQMAQGFAEIKKTLDTMITDRPVRVVDFEE